MKQLFFALSLLLILISCSSKRDISKMLIADSGFEIYPQKLKSSIIELGQKNMKEIILLLHNRVETEDIIEYFNIKKDDYDLIINTLYGEGLIKKSTSGKFIPACMVVNSEDEKEIRKFAGEFGSKISEIIIDRYSKIRNSNLSIPGFSAESFDNSSLFILYNVLLDKWQIKNIEEKFLRAEPPQRSGERYYLLIHQIDDETKSNQLSLMDNWCKEYKDYYFCTFGEVWNEYNLVNISRDRLITDFDMNENEEVVTFKENLIANILNSQKGSIHSAPPDSSISLKKYGIIKNNRLVLARITEDENKALYETAKIITDDLINYLNNQRPQLVKHYLQSVYKEETSFREWLFWIYKYMIAEAANKLIEKNYIKITDSNIFNYVIDKKIISSMK